MRENAGSGKGGFRVDRTPANQKEWRDLYEIVLTYAFKVTGSRVRAEDLTQEAFVRLKTTRPWDSATEPSLARHMMKIVKSLLFHDRKSDTARRAREGEAVVEQQTLGGKAAPSPEQTVVEQGSRERSRLSAAEQLAELRERLAGHSLELAIIDLVDEGILDRGEQAERTRCTKDQVYEAWRRIRRHLKQLPPNDDDEDEEVA
jgi:DNA-directed RNA polymerase specialized sigma24 family protein